MELEGCFLYSHPGFSYFDLMVQKEFINKKTGERILAFEDSDFEFEKPVKHYSDFFIYRHMVVNGVPEEDLRSGKNPSETSKAIFIEGAKEWQEMFKDYQTVSLSENLVKLLDSKKKAEQGTLLEGEVITPDVLMALIIKADEAGYLLSQYTSEFLPNGIDPSQLPLAFTIEENGEVKKYGKTKLSDAQLKQVIEHRKVKVAKFLDRGDEWHCFFVTYTSLNGQETWLGEKQPHFHYISNAFGIPREKVVEQLKSKKYKLGNPPHITLKEYGRQPDDDSVLV